MKHEKLLSLRVVSKMMLLVSSVEIRLGNGEDAFMTISFAFGVVPPFFLSCRPETP